MREEIKKTFVVHTQNPSSAKRSAPAPFHLGISEVKRQKGLSAASTFEMISTVKFI